MTRRYADVEPKPADELEPGDEIFLRRRVVAVTRTATPERTHVLVEWDDGTTETFDMAHRPMLDVVAKRAAD